MRISSDSRDEGDLRLPETTFFDVFVFGGRLECRRKGRWICAVDQRYRSLSIILREEGVLTRIAEVCEEVGYRPDLNEEAVERILAELEQRKTIQRQ